jgi:hypothetical protein
MTYVNNIFTYIIDPLDLLIQNEFSGVPITFDEPVGNESFLIVPSGDELMGLRGAGQVRDYSVEVTYTYKAGADYQKDIQFQHLTEIAERFKRLVWDNTDGSNWFDGRVESIEYGQDEENAELFTAKIECSFSREEVI